MHGGHERYNGDSHRTRAITCRVFPVALLARCQHCRHEFPIAAKFRGAEVECVACGERFPFTDGPEWPDTDEDYVVESTLDDGEPEIDVEREPVQRRRSGLALRLT